MLQQIIFYWDFFYYECWHGNFFFLYRWIIFSLLIFNLAVFKEYWKEKFGWIFNFIWFSNFERSWFLTLSCLINLSHTSSFLCFVKLSLKMVKTRGLKKRTGQASFSTLSQPSTSRRYSSRPPASRHHQAEPANLPTTLEPIH